MGHESTKIAAIIVTYYPDKRKIKQLIDAIISQVSHVFVIDNGSTPDFPVLLNHYKSLTYLPMNENIGLGAALNVGLRHAQSIDCSHIITFDQDSVPSADMVDKLLAASNQLIADGAKVATVGPSYVDLRQNPPMQYPFYRKSGWHVQHIFYENECKTVEVDALITSGCLYQVDIFDRVKIFDEGYFVDYIDTDWCFDARSRGFSIFGVCDAKMFHELGSGESITFATIRLIEYSPLRRYYYFRNTINFVGRPYVPYFWKIRLICGLLIRMVLLPVTPGSQKLQQLVMMFRGIIHGLSGIKGPFHDNR